MNCNHCRYELSQCLDGRLPSGRRALVMEHVAQCRGCETFWNELQAAQQLVLQLPRERGGEHSGLSLIGNSTGGSGYQSAILIPNFTMLFLLYAWFLLQQGRPALRPERVRE